MFAILALCGCAVPAVGAPARAVPGTGDPWLVYVANAASGSVSVIDTFTNAVVTTILVGAGPTSVSVTPDGTTAEVVSRDGTVSVIDTFTNTVAGTKTGIRFSAQTAATTPDGAVRYVVDAARDVVSVVNTATNAVVATIGGVGDGPCALAITPDGATAYVANARSGTVSLIDTASNSILGVVPVGRLPSSVAITPDQAPTAALAVTPAPAGRPTTLGASAATVRFGTIASYAWSFGDGSTATTTVPTATHTYARPGSYAVAVTLTSSGGTSTTQVRSGRTVIRNGDPRARVTRTVTIPALAGGEAGGLPITGTAAGSMAMAGLLATLLGAVLVVLSRRIPRRSGRRAAAPARRRHAR